MRATTEPMEGNLVRLSVEIDEPEFDRALSDVVRALAKQVRVPGFRPGKVPRKVLEARMGGAGALRAEALRESLPDFYAQAVVDTELDPIAQPEIDITAGEDAGAVSFDAVVQVRPLVAIPGYDGLSVTLPGLVVTEDEMQRQIDRLRENDAELEVVSRPAIDGDLVTIDLHGNDASGAEVVGVDDYLYEVGTGTVVPELDNELHGAKAGAILAFDAANPAEPDERVAFRVLVKEVKVKRLPEVTDEWASESSEFDTVSELRADIEKRIGQVKLIQSQMALRQKSIEALSGLVARGRGARGPGGRRGQRAPARPAAPPGGPEDGPGRVLPGHGHVARRAAGGRAGGRRGGGEGRSGAAGPGRGRGGHAQ